MTVRVRVAGYKDTCALAGRPLMTGMEATATGHYHVLLDGSLLNMLPCVQPVRRNRYPQIKVHQVSGTDA